MYLGSLFVQIEGRRRTLQARPKSPRSSSLQPYEPVELWEQTWVLGVLGLLGANGALVTSGLIAKMCLRGYVIIEDVGS